MNIAEVLEKQMKSPTYNSGHIYIGTVTDPYQKIEEKYKLTRSILKVLVGKSTLTPETSIDVNTISILSKSDLVLRDIDLLKQFKSIDVNITINTLDEEWKSLIKPDSPPVKHRLDAIKKLNDEGISTCVMMGPYWPFFTDADALFKRFKDAGVKHVFSESLNTTGGNWTEVEHVLEKHYPQLLKKMQDIMFNKNNFHAFYNNERKRIMKLSEQYKIPATVYFGLGHATKSVQNSATAK